MGSPAARPWGRGATRSPALWGRGMRRRGGGRAGARGERGSRRGGPRPSAGGRRRSSGGAQLVVRVDEDLPVRFGHLSDDVLGGPPGAGRARGGQLLRELGEAGGGGERRGAGGQRAAPHRNGSLAQRCPPRHGAAHAHGALHLRQHPLLLPLGDAPEAHGCGDSRVRGRGETPPSTTGTAGVTAMTPPPAPRVHRAGRGHGMGWVQHPGHRSQRSAQPWGGPSPMGFPSPGGSQPYRNVPVLLGGGGEAQSA